MEQIRVVTTGPAQGFREFILAANRLYALGAIDLAEDTNDFFGAVKFLLHEYFLLGKK
tara:strand:- start:56 stop:229 length:174 start_codon:yes stop_codon:yes gene_type:complete